jgi:hypothetical protein
MPVGIGHTGAPAAVLAGWRDWPLRSSKRWNTYGMVEATVAVTAWERATNASRTLRGRLRCSPRAIAGAGAARLSGVMLH